MRTGTTVGQRDSFLNNAASILDTATAAHRSEAGLEGGSEGGSEDAAEDWTILIGHDGQLQMIAASDWPLDSLARERGARMAFRVSHSDDKVRVDGREGLRTCSFTAEPSNTAMQKLLNGPAMFRLQ